MRERYFLDIDGIQGESTDEDHGGEIDVSTWSWGVDRAGGPGPGGAGSGRAQFDELQVSARISAASPRLAQSCVTGRHHRTAVLTGVQSAGDSEAVEFLRYSLADVSITSVRHADADVTPIEEVSLSYQRIEIAYTPQSATGAPGTPITFSWDARKGG